MSIIRHSMQVEKSKIESEKLPTRDYWVVDYLPPSGATLVEPVDVQVEAGA
jgi:hypothetical protein